MKVFVYGTLKRGYGNNVLLEKATYVGEFTVRGYKLYNSGFPVAIPSADDTMRGEVWDIENDSVTLNRLDRLESNGYMYNRTPEKATSLDGSITLDVQTYVGHDKFWALRHLAECSVVDGAYEWSRPRY